MANQQTRALRKAVGKNFREYSLFTQTSYGGGGKKKHEVTVCKHEHSKIAFDPSRARLKNKQRNRPPRQGWSEQQTAA
jgi:hypothetical protein